MYTIYNVRHNFITRTTEITHLYIPSRYYCKVLFILSLCYVLWYRNVNGRYLPHLNTSHPGVLSGGTEYKYFVVYKTLKNTLIYHRTSNH